MPRKTKKEWKHPLYAIGYCYERYDKVYLRVKDKKKATHLVWDERNKSEAIELLENFIRSQIYEIKEEFTISYVMPKFLEHIKNKVSNKSYLSYIRNLPVLLNKDFELKDTIGIREHLQTNIKELHRSGKKHNTIVFIISSASALFNYAIDNEYMTKNPFTKTMKLSQVKSEHYTPTIEEFDIFLSQVLKNSKHLDLYYICKFIQLTGMRITEALSLKWIDVLKDFIKITGKKVTVKENKYRHFPLTPFPNVVELVNEIKKQKFTNEFIFGNFSHIGKILLMNKYCDYLGIKQFQFHAIRRLAIECWKREGINRSDRALLAGHDETVQKAKYELDVNVNELSNRIIKQKI